MQHDTVAEPVFMVYSQYTVGVFPIIYLIYKSFNSIAKAYILYLYLSHNIALLTIGVTANITFAASRVPILLTLWPPSCRHTLNLINQFPAGCRTAVTIRMHPLAAQRKVALAEIARPWMVHDPWPRRLQPTAFARLPMDAPTYLKVVAADHHRKALLHGEQRIEVEIPVDLLTSLTHLSVVSLPPLPHTDGLILPVLA